MNKCLFSSQFSSLGVELCHKPRVLYPFYAKYAQICCNYLKISGFSSKINWYPRYQDTSFLQLCVIPPLHWEWVAPPRHTSSSTLKTLSNFVGLYSLFSAGKRFLILFWFDTRWPQTRRETRRSPGLGNMFSRAIIG